MFKVIGLDYAAIQAEIEGLERKIHIFDFSWYVPVFTPFASQQTLLKNQFVSRSAKR